MPEPDAMQRLEQEPPLVVSETWGDDEVGWYRQVEPEAGDPVGPWPSVAHARWVAGTMGSFRDVEVS